MYTSVAARVPALDVTPRPGPDMGKTLSICCMSQVIRPASIEKSQTGEHWGLDKEQQAVTGVSSVKFAQPMEITRNKKRREGGGITAFVPVVFWRCLNSNAFRMWPASHEVYYRAAGVCMHVVDVVGKACQVNCVFRLGPSKPVFSVKRQDIDHAGMIYKGP